MASILSTLNTGQIELISTFVSGPGQIEASLTDNWQTIGGAFLCGGEADIKLNIIALITDNDYTGTVRLYDISPDVEGSRVISTTTIPGSDFNGGGPLTYTSSIFKVFGNHTYVVQARFIGTPDPDAMFLITNVIPVNA